MKLPAQKAFHNKNKERTKMAVWRFAIMQTCKLILMSTEKYSPPVNPLAKKCNHRPITEQHLVPGFLFDTARCQPFSLADKRGI